MNWTLMVVVGADCLFAWKAVQSKTSDFKAHIVEAAGATVCLVCCTKNLANVEELQTEVGQQLDHFHEALDIPVTLLHREFPPISDPELAKHIGPKPCGDDPERVHIAFMCESFDTRQ